MVAAISSQNPFFEPVRDVLLLDCGLGVSNFCLLVFFKAGKFMAVFINLDGGFQKEINYADLLKVLWSENQLGFLPITHLLFLYGPCTPRPSAPAPQVPPPQRPKSPASSLRTSGSSLSSGLVKALSSQMLRSYLLHGEWISQILEKHVGHRKANA